ncbi:MAG TPA: hypothetical protein VI299_26515, partial [Polyangiales bacterium]
MRMRSEALAWLAAASLAAGACGKGEATQEGAAAPSTGGEAPAAAAPTSNAPAGGNAPAAAAAPNPFGSPDAEKGTPLPPRNPMNGSAKSDYDDGIKKASQGDLAGARRVRLGREVGS